MVGVHDVGAYDCPECGSTIPEDCGFCSSCGWEQDEEHFFEDGMLVCPEAGALDTGIGINYCPMCGFDLPPDIVILT